MTETATRRPKSDDSVIRDRRRPGRADSVNPAVIPMLRGEFTSDEALEDTEGHGEAPEVMTTEQGSTDTSLRDDLAAARGTIFGAVVGLAAWAIIGMTIWLIWGL